MMKNKGVLKCASLVLCLVCLLHCFVFPVACLDYSANPPSYINYRCFYIEVNTSQLGRGTIILPDNYKWDDISTYKTYIKQFCSSKPIKHSNYYINNFIHNYSSFELRPKILYKIIIIIATIPKLKNTTGKARTISNATSP